MGDTRDWYAWHLGGYAEATLRPCTVRGMGQHWCVVVDHNECNVSINQAGVVRTVSRSDDQSIGSFPDQGIWDLSTSHFGDQGRSPRSPSLW